MEQQNNSEETPQGDLFKTGEGAAETKKPETDASGAPPAPAAENGDEAKPEEAPGWATCFSGTYRRTPDVEEKKG